MTQSISICGSPSSCLTNYNKRLPLPRPFRPQNESPCHPHYHRSKGIPLWLPCHIRERSLRISRSNSRTSGYRVYIFHKLLCIHPKFPPLTLTRTDVNDKLFLSLSFASIKSRWHSSGSALPRSSIISPMIHCASLKVSCLSPSPFQGIQNNSSFSTAFTISLSLRFVPNPYLLCPRLYQV